MNGHVHVPVEINFMVAGALFRVAGAPVETYEHRMLVDEVGVTVFNETRTSSTFYPWHRIDSIIRGTP